MGEGSPGWAAPPFAGASASLRLFALSGAFHIHFGEFPEALRPEIARNRLLSLRSLTATWANAGSTLDVGLASLGKLAKMDMKQEMTGIALLASALIAASRPAR